MSAQYQKQFLLHQTVHQLLPALTFSIHSRNEPRQIPMAFLYILIRFLFFVNLLLLSEALRTIFLLGEVLYI